MPKMICLACDTVSDFEDCLQFSQHWNDDYHATEHFAGMRCPECGAEGELLAEAVYCDRCHIEHEPGTLIAGQICEDCFNRIIKLHPDLVIDFLKEEGIRDEFAEFALEKL